MTHGDTRPLSVQRDHLVLSMLLCAADLAVQVYEIRQWADEPFETSARHALRLNEMALNLMQFAEMDEGEFDKLRATAGKLEKLIGAFQEINTDAPP